MRSIVYHRYGEPSDVLQIQDSADIPRPATGEVLIKVIAAPFLHGSLLAIRGRYRGPRDSSMAPPNGGRQGYEGVGVIEAVGPEIAAGRGLSVGRRVSFFPGLGAWSEKVVVPAAFVTPIDDDIPDKIAAQLHVNPLTAVMLMNAAIEAGVVPGGERAVVLDAAGASVAKLVAALARRRDIPVISIVRSREGARRLSQLLPDVDVVASADPDWLDQLDRVAPPSGLFVGLDAVGGPVGSAILDRLAQGGSLITYGDLSGEPLQANALSFAMRDTHVRGLVVTKWPSLPAQQRAKDFALAVELARERPELFPVAAEYRLEDIAKAARHVEQAGKDGLVLLRP